MSCSTSAVRPIRVLLLFSLDLAAEARFRKRRLCNMILRSSSDIFLDLAAVVPLRSVR